MTTTESQFSIAEKEVIVSELREKLARAKHEARLAHTETEEAKAREDAAWTAVGEAASEYNLCERALLEQIEQSL